MKDQFGNDIPKELVILHWTYIEDLPDDLAKSLLEAVDQADWYAVEHVIGIDWEVLRAWQDAHECIFDPIELEDAGIDLSRIDGKVVGLLAHWQHRWDPELTGFYYA